jgi:hypothetical protein
MARATPKSSSVDVADSAGSLEPEELVRYSRLGLDESVKRVSRLICERVDRWRGRIGSPAALYRCGQVAGWASRDHDLVDLTNLQRQAGYDAQRGAENSIRTRSAHRNQSVRPSRRSTKG